MIHMKCLKNAEENLEASKNIFKNVMIFKDILNDK